MRRTNSTTVSVLVNDRSDRKNVVVALRTILRHLPLIVRGRCMNLARQYGEAKQRLEAMFVASAGSPSWGGHSPSGGPGTAPRS